MEIKINTTKTIKLETSINIDDVNISIFNSESEIISTGLMIEKIPGIYFYPWTPNIMGNYTAKIESQSLNLSTYVDIDVVANFNVSQLMLNQKIINEGVQSASLLIPHSKEIN